MIRHQLPGPKRNRLPDPSPAPDSALDRLGRIRLDPGQDKPLHAQLAMALRTQIREGHLSAGTSLAGELELAAALGISRHTVRHALGVLVSEGWLHRRRGARAVVVPHRPDDTVIERQLGTFYAFAWEVEARGGRHHSQLLARDTLLADARLAQVLAIELGAPVERIERLRSANGEPLTLEVSILPAALSTSFEDAALKEQSIYDLLEQRHKISVLRATESLKPVVLEARVAGLLGVPPGSPAFSVERVSWSRRGPIEWQQSLIRGDRYLYSVELPRSVRTR